MPITYLRGDVTNGTGPRCIIHICNDQGKWGRGFVLALSARWEEPERAYRKWSKDGTHHQAGEFELGNVQRVAVQTLTSKGTLVVWVCNMIAQHGVGVKNGVPPIRYDALRECLIKVNTMVPDLPIHAPRIGCGLAGATWDKVEPIIQETLSHREVVIFDF